MVIATTAQQTSATANHITIVSPSRPSGQIHTTSPAKAVSVSAAQQGASNSLATITFSLPTEPVPKNQLGMASEPQQIFPAPLNPAQIQLPPSVATALQNMNQKAKPGGFVVAAAPTTPVKQEQITQIAAPGGHVIKQLQGVVDGEAGQLALAGGSFPGLVAAGGGPQVIYYVMPSTVQSLSTGGEVGATQFVALPAGALQATVPVSSVNGSFPQWIIGNKEVHHFTIKKVCFVKM